MRNYIISNDFYVSEFLLNDLDLGQFQILYERELKLKSFNKTISRIRAFLSCTPGIHNNVIAFAIENILTIDYVYRNIGKPKVWLWNPISSMTKKNRKLFLSYIRRKQIEVWTFDEGDVEAYGFHFHNQIHSSSLMSYQKYDDGSAFFSGVDKGRLDTVKKIKMDLECASILPDFHIVRDKNKVYSKENIGLTTDFYINFEDYLKKIEGCRIVVDVGQHQQEGITLRVVEALLLDKKLITTNALVEEMDFYTPANIYLYGKEERGLVEFINEPLEPISDEVKRDYTFKKLIYTMLHW